MRAISCKAVLEKATTSIEIGILYTRYGYTRIEIEPGQNTVRLRDYNHKPGTSLKRKNEEGILRRSEST
jgi:hypothetical protein